MSIDKESSAAGTDNRPPMLVESDYESDSRIKRYICGKPLGKLIWRSIQNEPTPHPQITMTEGQGDAAVQVMRDKRDEEFTEIENNKELADIQATNIPSQGLSRHVFNILNQTRTGKEIWDNVELLMKVPQSSNDAMLATMNQIVNLLSGFQKQFPPTNNQLRTSSNSRSHATVHDGQIITETVQRRAPGNVGNTGNRGTQNYGQMTDNVGKKVICYNCRGEGHVSRQCKEKKRVKDSQYFKDKMLLMEAKEKGTVLDAEAEAFLADVECTAPYDQPLAITTTNMFEVSHEDAYDSDVDEGPHAAAAFMANLSSTSGTNGATTSQVNEVHTDANQIFDNVNHLLTHEMHQEEHLDSDVESDIDDNTIMYHQYQLDSEV
ncbi:retrovirus-related pol polyprotein from transposon TNT 1-94 [Tanacetum coccineum]